MITHGLLMTQTECDAFAAFAMTSAKCKYLIYITQCAGPPFTNMV